MGKTLLKQGAAARAAERMGREVYRRNMDLAEVLAGMKPAFRDACERGFSLERKATRRRLLTKVEAC